MIDGWWKQRFMTMKHGQEPERNSARLTMYVINKIQIPNALDVSYKFVLPL